MTTERGSQDPGTDPTTDDALDNVDALVGTRDDEMTSAGLSDAPYSSSTTLDTGSYGTSSMGSGSGDRLQQAAGSVVDRVAGTTEQKVGTQVNSQLSRGAEMREQQPQIASFADTAAQQVDKASQFLRETDFQGLVREGENFARRQPAVFLGGALALGILASRFLKASPQGGSGQGFQYRRGFGSGYGAGYGSGYGSTYGRSGYGSSYGGSAYGGGYGADGSQQANYASSSTSSSASTGGSSYAEPGSGTTSDQGAENGGV